MFYMKHSKTMKAVVTINQGGLNKLVYQDFQALETKFAVDWSS